MLLTREEMGFDFQGAKFDRVKDREMLAWIASQFLYGEFTGIQCGHWVLNAPDYESARFYARQCIEELQHVDAFVDLFKWLGAKPTKAHWVVKLLSTESSCWEEHVALEMAQGEGFVLMIFYAIMATIDDEKIVKRLDFLCRQEEGHVDFGEQQLMKLIRKDPRWKKRLLGLHLLSLSVARRMEGWVKRRMDMSHPVMQRFPAYVQRIIEVTELRLRRIGILEKPLSEFGLLEKSWAIARSLAWKTWRKIAFWKRQPRLTEVYMRDPVLADVMRQTA